MNYFDLIEDYIDGNLSPQTHKLFEDELALNDALKKELELHKMASLIIDESIKDDIAAGIKSIRNEKSTNQSSSLRFLYLGLSIAASIALVVSVFIIGGPNQSPTLFAQTEYEAFRPNFSGSRGSDDPSEKIGQLLEAEKGEEAETLLLNQKPINHYLLGHAYFVQKKYADALASFEKVSVNSQEGDIATSQQAAFYAALSLMALEREEEGLDRLREIANDDEHTFQSLAKQSLQRWAD